MKEIDKDNIELSIVIKKKLKEIDKDNIELLIEKQKIELILNICAPREVFIKL